MKRSLIYMLLLCVIATFVSTADRAKCSVLIASNVWGDREFSRFIKGGAPDKDVRLYRQGLELIKRNKYGEAIKCLTSALKISEEWKIALYNRGLCYERLGDMPRAKKDYVNSLGYDPFGADYKKAQDNQPAHLEIIVTFHEIHPDFCKITQFGRATGRNRSFAYFCDNSPNIISPEQTFDFVSGDSVAKMEKQFLSFSDQPGYGMWAFFFFPAKRPKAGGSSEYSVTYKVSNLPHLHGNTLVSMGSNPIPILTDKWILAFAFPQNTLITSMFDLPPYKYEKRDGWIIFYYDYIGVKKPAALHIEYTLAGDNKRGLDATKLTY